MKNYQSILLILSLLFSVQLSVAQSTCSNAIVLSQNDMYDCDITYNLNDTIVWFKFTADTTEVILSVGTLYPTADSTISHIKNIDVYAGLNCGNLLSIYNQSYAYEDSTAFYSNFISGFTIYDDYFIRIELYGLYSNCFICPGSEAELNLCLRRHHHNDEVCNRGCPHLANGNLVANGTFDDGICVNGASNPFCPDNNLYCQDCWETAWGSPQANTVTNNTYAWMWTGFGVNGLYGEAIMTNPNNYSLNILPNRNYLLSFDIQFEINTNPTNVTELGINFHLLDPANNNPALPVNACGGSGGVLPNINTGNLIHQQVINNTTWQHNSVCFNLANPGNNLSLLFFPILVNGPWNVFTYGWIGLDNVYLNLLNDPGPPVTINSACQPVTLGPECPINDPNITYEWFIGSSLIGTTPNITVYPNATTTYTLVVTVNGQFGCSESQTVTVTVLNPVSPPPAPIINGVVSACAQGNANYNISNILPGATYTWTTVNSVPPGASGTGTLAVVDFSDYQGGSITFTVTDANGCSNSSTFTVYACCLPDLPNGDIDLSGWTASDYFNQFGNINGVWAPPNNTGPYVIINTFFNVDIPFQINTSNILLGPNARIDVQAGGNLQIRDCWLHSCSGYMWDAIYSQGTTCSLTIVGSFIEDAQKAVYFTSDATLTVTNNKFNKNFVSIFLGNYGSATTKIFHSNHFLCTDNIFSAPPYSVIDFISLQPHAGRRSHKGFDLVNVLGFEANHQLQSYSTNIFFNHNFGIYGFNSDITAFNNFFDRIINDGQTKPPPQGIAIYSRSNTATPVILRVGNHVPGSVFENEFNNCAIGVMGTGNFTSTIRYNEFHNISWESIFVGNNRNSHSITDNSMFDSFMGIESQDINQPPAFLIARNLYINTSGVVGNFHNTAILVQNSVAMNSNLVISDNILDNVRYGVFLRNVSSTQVINNPTITFNVGNSNNMHTGVWIENSPATHVRNNVITCYYQAQPTNQLPGATNIRGIHAQNSRELRIFDNTITNMGYSMSFLDNVNGSKLKCNVMNDYLEGIRLSNASLPTQGDPGIAWDNEWHLPSGGSFSRVAGTTQGGGQLIWHHINSPAFIPLPCNPLFLVSAVLTSTGDCSYPDGERREDYSGEAADTLNTSIPEEDYMAKEDAYKFFAENPDQLNLAEPEDVVYQSFYNTMDAGIIGEKEAITELIRDEDYTNALAAVTAMTDTNLLEYNFKVVNEIYLNCCVSDTTEMTEAQRIALENIAYQLPLLGGSAVYQARAILGLEIIDDYSNFRIRNSQSNYVTKDEKLNIFYPNPAKNELWINFHCDNKCVVELFDLTGRSVKSISLNGNSFSIKDIPSGNYLIVLSRNNELITRESVHIIR